MRYSPSIILHTEAPTTEGEGAKGIVSGKASTCVAGAVKSKDPGGLPWGSVLEAGARDNAGMVAASYPAYKCIG